MPNDSNFKVEGSVSVKHSRFNLPAFSFLVCFVLLIWQWWPEVDGPIAAIFIIGLAALASLVGWFFIALLLKLALSLPLAVTRGADRLVSVCYAATFGLMLFYWLEPGAGVVDVLLVMAISAVLAIPCCLVLIIPARIIAKFVADLFGQSSKTLVKSQPSDSEQIVGCVSTKRCGRNSELQLWIHEEQGLFHFQLRQLSSVRHVSGSLLEVGKPQASYKLALEQGQEAMARRFKS